MPFFINKRSESSKRIQTNTHTYLLGNNITDNKYGWSSSFNDIVGNSVTNNDYGFYLDSAKNNFIYNNDFVNNIQQAYSSGVENVWDDGYPSGGNYWSNYTGVDLLKGRYQNITGSDGIGDTAHTIDANNKDRYPSMSRTGWWSNTCLNFSLTPSPTYVDQTVTMLGNLVDRLGRPIINARVGVLVNGTFSGNLFTNSSGWFKASARVDTTGIYIIRVSFNGTSVYNPSSCTETLAVYPKTDTNVSFTLSPNPATVGQKVNLTGNLTDAFGNLIGKALLELYLRIGNGSWQFKANFSTNSSG